MVGNGGYSLYTYEQNISIPYGGYVEIVIFKIQFIFKMLAAAIWARPISQSLILELDSLHENK
jgi:hypothetical protein